MTLLLVTAAGAWFMAGAGWIIQVVHYPLFAMVGEERWAAYHAAHSRRVTPVVLTGMSTELGGALLVAGSPPDGVGGGAAVAGAVLAVLPWVLTGLAAVPAHGALARGFDAATHRRLLRADLARTLAWTAHGVLAAVLVAQAA